MQILLSTGVLRIVRTLKKVFPTFKNCYLASFTR